MPRGRPPKGAARPASDLLELLQLWQRAASSPQGIAIPCANPNRLLQRLYAARREVGGFHDLKLVECAEEVKIVKRGS